MTDSRLFPDYTSVLLPRMLSAIDRDPFSETRGCADRSFWGWKTKDFPDATLSRIALLLHQIDPQKYQNEILWVLEFLRKIQHRDGSFDQAFPNEHSHGATAFLLHDLAEIMLSEPSLLDSFGDILEKNGHYLIKYRETHGQISNHIAGTAAALFGLWKLTKDARYRKTAEDYLHLVLQNQSAEGWYPEYGGADPSYQTLCIDYLASCYEITKQELLLSSLKKAISFVSYFAHPDGSFGGEYGSRNCEIFYPGGIAVLSKYLSEASSLLAWATQSFSKSKTVTPLSVDLENLSPLFSSILQAEKVASTNAADRQSNLLPGDQQPFVQDFPEAGIYIVNQDICYSILSWKKGGIVKSFDKKAKKKVVDDCGIILLKNNRNVATSQFFFTKSYFSN